MWHMLCCWSTQLYNALYVNYWTGNSETITDCIQNSQKQNIPVTIKRNWKGIAKNLNSTFEFSLKRWNTCSYKEVASLQAGKRESCCMDKGTNRGWEVSCTITERRAAKYFKKVNANSKWTYKCHISHISLPGSTLCNTQTS